MKVEMSFSPISVDEAEGKAKEGTSQEERLQTASDLSTELARD